MFSDKTMANFKSKYKVDPDTGCWVWVASKARGGYGQLFTSVIDGHKWYRAHRFSYMVHHGDIPEGMVVMHSCDNPACVNPEHLTVGTQAENIADRDGKKRGVWSGDKHRKIYLTPEQIQSILDSDESDRALAKKIGCTCGWIWKVRHNRIAWVRDVMLGRRS